MFRFTIRELLLLTLSVAIAVGWWINREQLLGEIREAKRYETSAYRWHAATIAFAQQMREQGWYVAVRDDGSWSTSRPSENEGWRETATKLNNANPLPKEYLIPQE